MSDKIMLSGTIDDHNKYQEHKSIKLWCDEYECEIEIDIKIAPLIKEIWKAGISTVNSCENNVPENYFWIQFRSSSDLEKFLIVTCSNKKLLNMKNGNMI
jgi:hypothetical protein